MNNKGQTLIMFIILIPIFLILTAIVVDVGLIEYNYQKYKGIVDESIKEYFLNGGSDALNKTMNYNGLESKDYEITIVNDTVEVLLNYNIESVFGKIINLNEYSIKINRVGKFESENVVIDKKET